MRWIALVAVVVALATPGPVAPAGPCPDQVAPPGPPAATEVGLPVPDPVPVPAVPVGGDALGCGEIAATTSPLPPIGAASYVLADLDSGAVLATRAPHARHRPASTLKVLAALLAIRSLDPDAVVPGAPEDMLIDGSKAGIGPGGQYSVRQLLAALLLNSGNDAAQALARAMGGDAATTARMTALAGELGALDTRAATPSGLDAPGMASSAYDLAVIYRVAMREPLFAQTIATPSVQFPGYDLDHPGFELSNSSRLLTAYPGSLGSKSGFTEAARHTLVAAADRNGRRLVVALMRSENAPEPLWRQAAALLDWGFAQPAGVAPVGVLVDRAPAPPPPATAAPPAAAAPPPPAAGPDEPPVVLWIGAGVLVVVALAGVGVVVVRGRRH